MCTYIVESGGGEGLHRRKYFRVRLYIYIYIHMLAKCRKTRYLYMIRSPSWPVWSPGLSPPPATPPQSPRPAQRSTVTPSWSSPRSRFWSLRQAKQNHHHQPQQSSPQVCTHHDAFRTPENKHGGGFRFPPWSGPSPRTHSSPGLLPLTPDSPR